MGSKVDRSVIATLPSGLLSTGIAYTSSVVFTNASSFHGGAVSSVFAMLFDVSWGTGSLPQQAWDAAIVPANGSTTHDFGFTLPSSANNQTITITATVITSDGAVVDTTQQQATCGQPVTIYPGYINWKSSGQVFGFEAYDGIVVPYYEYVALTALWVNIGSVAVTGSVLAYVTSPSGALMIYNASGNSPYTLAPGAAAVYVPISGFRNAQFGTYKVLFKLYVGGVVVSEASYTFGSH